MGRGDPSGPLEARNPLLGLIVQEPLRESLAFGDSLDLDSDRSAITIAMRAIDES